VGDFNLVALGLLGTAIGFLLMGPSPLLESLDYSASPGMQVRYTFLGSITQHYGSIIKPTYQPPTIPIPHLTPSPPTTTP
jgi:hypothetical protein